MSDDPVTPHELRVDLGEQLKQLFARTKAARGGKLTKIDFSQSIGVAKNYFVMIEGAATAVSAAVLNKALGALDATDAEKDRARWTLAASQVEDADIRKDMLRRALPGARRLRKAPAPDTKSTELERELREDVTFQATWNRVKEIYMARDKSPNWRLLVQYLNTLPGVEAALIVDDGVPQRPDGVRGVVGAVTPSTRKKSN